MSGNLDRMTFREALRSAKADIAKATMANDIMIKAAAEGMRDEPDLEYERQVAMLVNGMWEISPNDILLMWAVLVIEQAQEIKDEPQ